MALSAAINWECRADGDNDHGGGYSSGGTDYSQQDEQQLAISDLACADHVTFHVTSPTGQGFTAAMVGNVMKVTSTGTGGHFVVGWYEITAYVAATEVVLDRDPTDGTNDVGANANVGGALGVPTDAFFEQCVAGNTIYMEGPGTYTLTGAVTVANDGTAANPITIFGYKTNHDTAATGDDRPNIVAGANSFQFDDYWIFRHLRGSGSNTQALRADLGGVFENLDFENTSGAANRMGIYSAGTGFLINCRAKSANGQAFKMATYAVALGCVAYESLEGFDFVVNSKGIGVISCIIDSCTTGIAADNSHSFLVANNTLYTGTTGISGTGAQAWVVNNIITGFTTGASWGSSIPNHHWDYNDWYDNTADVSNVTKGDHALALDPQFVDAAGGDFRIGTNLRIQAFPGELPGGLCTGYPDVGAVQRREPGAAHIIGG